MQTLIPFLLLTIFSNFIDASDHASDYKILNQELTEEQRNSMHELTGRGIMETYYKVQIPVYNFARFDEINERKRSTNPQDTQQWVNKNMYDHIQKIVTNSIDENTKYPIGIKYHYPIKDCIGSRDPQAAGLHEVNCVLLRERIENPINIELKTVQEKNKLDLFAWIAELPLWRQYIIRWKYYSRANEQKRRNNSFDAAAFMAKCKKTSCTIS